MVWIKGGSKWNKKKEKIIYLGMNILWQLRNYLPWEAKIHLHGVGACIVSEDNRILSIGYNGAPNGFSDEKFPWAREGDNLNTKYPYVCHAELNAVLNFRGNKKDLENAKIYVDLFPCNECAKIIIQSGIKEVIYLSDKYADSENNIASRKLFDECDVKYSKIKLDKQREIKIDLK